MDMNTIDMLNFWGGILFCVGGGCFLTALYIIVAKIDALNKRLDELRVDKKE